MGQRHPKVVPVGQGERLKRWIGYTDHDERHSIQTYGLADDGLRSAEGLLPKAIVQDCDGRRFRSVVSICDEPAQVGANTKGRKVIS